MPTLWLMCGASFSGKSTVAAALAEARGAVLISLDAINAERGLYGGEGVPVEEWERTSAIAGERLREVASKTGADVVLDDTNCFRWLRDRWRKRAEAIGYAARLVYLDVPAETLRARRARNASTRERRGISDPVFEEHLRTFEPPAEDEQPVRLGPSLDPQEWARSSAFVTPPR